MSSVIFLFFVLPLSLIVGVLVGSVASFIASVSYPDAAEVPVRVATFVGLLGWVCALVVLLGLVYG